MATPTEPKAPESAPAGTARGVVSTGWLGSQSVFGDGHQQGKRAAGATLASLALHGVFLLLVLAFFTYKAATTPDVPPMELPRLVYLQQPGPGGGGGGSPAPAPPRPIEIPKSKPPEPIPLTPVPPPPVPVPTPTFTAPVMTPNATLAQATGTSSVSLATYGGGGRGTGIGTGTGRGVGEGEGGGFGGGAYRLGSGITDPVPIRQPTPNYTSEAMRAKITGVVLLEIVINPDGTVGDVRVKRSLERGLDQEAMKTARLWLFRPARDREGKAVPVIADLELTFRLH
jgi:protein TonB